MFKVRRLSIASSFLIFTIILSLVLRVIHPKFGFPVLYTIPDEVPNYLTALEMLASHKIIASSQYPPLGSLVMMPFLALSYIIMRFSGVVSSLSNFELLLTTQEGYLLFIPRIISGVFGTLAVIVIYRIARLIFPKYKTTAFWSSVLLAFSVTQVQQSHIGKPWTGALLFCELGLYYLFVSIFEKKSKDFSTLLSALFFTIALGFHLASGIFFVLFFVLRFWLFRETGKKYKLAHRSLLTIAVSLLLIIFLSLVKVERYLMHVWELTSFIKLNATTGFYNSIFFCVKELWWTEPFITTFFILGMLFINRNKLINTLLLFTLIYFLIFALAYYQAVRYMFLIFPILALFGGYGIARILSLVRWVSLRRFTGTVLFFLILLPAIIWLQRYLAEPTFIETVNWINKNIPPQTRIGFMDIKFAGYTPAPASIELIQAKLPHAYERAKKLLSSNTYPENVREVVYLNNVVDVNDKKQILQYIHDHDIRYLVYFYRNPSERYKEEDFPGFHLCFHSSPFIIDREEESRDYIHWVGALNDMIKVNRFGPYFDIFKVS